MSRCAEIQKKRRKKKITLSRACQVCLQREFAPETQQRASPSLPPPRGAVCVCVCVCVCDIHTQREREREKERGRERERGETEREREIERG